MVFRCSLGWVLRISEWRGPESLGLGGCPQLYLRGACSHRCVLLRLLAEHLLCGP